MNHLTNLSTTKPNLRLIYAVNLVFIFRFKIIGALLDGGKVIPRGKG